MVQPSGSVHHPSGYVITIIRKQTHSAVRSLTAFIWSPNIDLGVVEFKDPTKNVLQKQHRSCLRDVDRADGVLTDYDT